MFWNGSIATLHSFQLAEDVQKRKKIIWWGTIKNLPRFRLMYKNFHPISYQVNFFVIV